MFPITIWAIWMTRNKIVLENLPFEPREVLEKIKAFYIGHFYSSTPCHKSRLKCTLVGWEAHHYSFFKLNIDGLAQRNSRRTNASGVIRDHKGTWINDFSRSIGYTHSMIAQLWGICDGIDAPSVVGIIISDFSTLPPVVFCTSF